MVEGELNEETGIYVNYINNIEVYIHCVYKSKSFKPPIESIGRNGEKVIVHFLPDTNINSVLNCITTEYICIVNQGIILTSNQWLTNLIYHYERIHKAGVIGISTDTSKQKPTFIHDIDFKETIVFSPENGIIEGVVFFSKILQLQIGAFAPNLHGWEVPHFCLRTIKNGYENFYIDGEFAMLQNCLDKDGHGRYNMQISLNKMESSNNWYIQP